ncbi:hypothetical protein BG015_001197 [Linnemannia schmuckeri]|uniref:Uncharacterized protein n=1 Tax=Linnemannia schmuckeri TaxID=64567 RepID=A0A9P5S418_9FUNG|nr:hypothetical protein BG015_001197 [Linnemannia schmuckeri]
MTKNMPDIQPRQSLKAQFSSEVHTVNARLDKKSGDYVILWKDIQMGLPYVQHVLDGSNIVSLLADDNFEEILYK